MEKHLTPVGNGLALFIDKTFQKLLNIDASTLLSIKTDGVRIVIEPVGSCTRKPKVELEPWMSPGFRMWSGAKTETDLRVAYYIRATFEDLRRDGLKDEQFRRLYQGGLVPRAAIERGWMCAGYAGRLIQQGGLFASSKDLATMHRLEACLRHREAGLEWNAAIEAALAEVPMLREDDGSELPGNGRSELPPEAGSGLRWDHDCEP